MDYKNEIARRLREARKEKGWTLEELSKQTGDLLDLKRISHYERGRRMLGHEEAVILAKALGKRLAYMMAVEDHQLPLSAQEEKLVRNWRTLNERDRMEIFRRLDMMAMSSRDPAADQRVSTALGRPKERSGKRRRSAGGGVGAEQLPKAARSPSR